MSTLGTSSGCQTELAILLSSSKVPTSNVALRTSSLSRDPSANTTRLGQMIKECPKEG